MSDRLEGYLSEQREVLLDFSLYPYLSHIIDNSAEDITYAIPKSVHKYLTESRWKDGFDYAMTAICYGDELDLADFLAALKKGLETGKVKIVDYNEAGAQGSESRKGLYVALYQNAAPEFSEQVVFDPDNAKHKNALHIFGQILAEQLSFAYFSRKPIVGVQKKAAKRAKRKGLSQRLKKMGIIVASVLGKPKKIKAHIIHRFISQKVIDMVKDVHWTIIAIGALGAIITFATGAYLAIPAAMIYFAGGVQIAAFIMDP